jgi:hypothetical protein
MRQNLFPLSRVRGGEMENQADDKANKPWVIRDVPEHTRREVKAYAAQHGMTVAEALEYLVGLSLQLNMKANVVGADGQTRKLELGQAVTFEDREEVALIADAILRLVEMRERRKAERKEE